LKREIKVVIMGVKMQTEVKVTETIKKERKKVFWRLYGLPIIILSGLSLFLLIGYPILFYKLMNEGGAISYTPNVLTEETKEEIYENGIREGIKKGEEKVLRRIETIGRGKFLVLSENINRNEKELEDGVLIYEEELKKDNENVFSDFRVGFLLFELEEKELEIIPRQLEKEEEELKTTIDYEKELVGIYEVLGEERFSELILELRIKEREYYFDYRDLELVEELKYPLEANIVGYSRVSIQKVIQELRKEGVNISLRVENLIKNASQEGIERSLDGFETYRRVNR
jgi:hypothetical protein